MAIREVEIGTVADFGTLQRFPRKNGCDSWFRELAYSSRIFGPVEAKKHGFISQIFDTKEEMYEAAQKLAETIAKKSPVAIVGSKISLNYSMDHSVEDGLNHIITLNSGLLQSIDTAEAAMASLSKKVPKFAKL